MIKLFCIFVMLILADRVIPESIHSEYVSAKLLQSGINTEFIMNRIEYTPNQKIHNLTFIKEVGIHPLRRAIFRCYCGNEFESRINHVKNKGTQSCGCHKIKSIKNRFTIHGLYKHPLYSIWQGMKNRCYNGNATKYKNYGGRGVHICNEWLNNPEAFIKWGLENGYREGLQIDKDMLALTKLGSLYSPKYCCFLTPVENARHKSNTEITMEIAIEIRDMKLQIPKIKNVELAKTFGVSKSIISQVLRYKTWLIQSIYPLFRS